MPTTGNSNSTVIHASDFTGLRFSDITIPIMLMIVKKYAAAIIRYTVVDIDANRFIGVKINIFIISAEHFRNKNVL